MAIAEGLSVTSKPGGYSAITVPIATSFVSIIPPHNAPVFGRGDSKMTGVTAYRNEAFEPSIDIISWSIDTAE
jgi:hypothetical protein